MRKLVTDTLSRYDCVLVHSGICGCAPLTYSSLGVGATWHCLGVSRTSHYNATLLAATYTLHFSSHLIVCVYPLSAELALPLAACPIGWSPRPAPSGTAHLCFDLCVSLCPVKPPFIAQPPHFIVSFQKHVSNPNK